MTKKLVKGVYGGKNQKKRDDIVKSLKLLFAGETLNDSEKNLDEFADVCVKLGCSRVQDLAPLLKIKYRLDFKKASFHLHKITEMSLIGKLNRLSSERKSKDIIEDFEMDMSQQLFHVEKTDINKEGHRIDQTILIGLIDCHKGILDYFTLNELFIKFNCL